MQGGYMPCSQGQGATLRARAKCNTSGPLSGMQGGVYAMQSGPLSGIPALTLQLALALVLTLTLTPNLQALGTWATKGLTTEVGEYPG